MEYNSLNFAEKILRNIFQGFGNLGILQKAGAITPKQRIYADKTYELLPLFSGTETWLLDINFPYRWEFGYRGKEPLFYNFKLTSNLSYFYSFTTLYIGRLQLVKSSTYFIPNQRYHEDLAIDNVPF